MNGHRLLIAALLLSACAPQPTTPIPAELRPMPSPTAALAATRVLATPVIIASPTPAPTPITHVVEAGDTLIGIAVKYAVSVDALQQANPGVQAQFLSIGTVLVIPQSQADLGAALAGAPTPVPLEIGPVLCRLDMTGQLTCLVEVANATSQPVTNVSVRLVLAGPDGLPLADAVVFLALDVLLPGERGPAAARFGLGPGGYAAAGATLISAYNAPAEAAARRLPVSAHSGRLAEAGYTVVGQVANLEGAPAASVWLTLALYDAEDGLLGYRQARLAGEVLGSGEARGFSISASPLAGVVHHYQITAEARP